ncbi:MAG: anthrone oxygenase family protein [Actinomycetota bacterium]
MSIADVLLTASVVATGLTAGLFYGWVVSVIPGTSRLESREYVTLMQHINREILTPRFLVLFAGVPVLLAATAIAQFRSGDQHRGLLVLGSTIIYTIGVFGITATRNVPLNDTLEAFDLATATERDIEEERAAYESTWNRWNAARAVANSAALVLVAAAAVLA